MKIFFTAEYDPKELTPLYELGEVVKHYDFSQAAIFWIGASVVSFLLPILNWGKKVKEE